VKDLTEASDEALEAEIERRRRRRENEIAEYRQQLREWLHRVFLDKTDSLNAAVRWKIESNTKGSNINHFGMDPDKFDVDISIIHN
jgi:molecular chaperone GrpE (heat shock protein)